MYPLGRRTARIASSRLFPLSIQLNCLQANPAGRMKAASRTPLWTLLLIVMLLASRAAYATTYTVTDNSDSTTDTGSLRHAIKSATSGSDIINFSGVIGTITLTSGTLAINNSVTITGPAANLLTISGNNASTVFTVNSGTVTISGLTIANGQGGAEGGGIFNSPGSTLTVSNCTFSGNTASVFGGGIFNGPGSTLTVSDCTFSGNTSSGGGGGIENYYGTLTVNNSTFSGNSANFGGGIENYYGALTANNSTFSGNSASLGDGIENYSALTLTNSIVAGNAGSDCDQCGTQSANNLIGGMSDLGPLQFNGGTTETMMPLPGSPAIGAGSSSTLATDQRGFARSTSASSDLGAVSTNYLTVTTLNDSGAGSLRDTVTTTNSDGSGDIIFQPGLTGAITLASALPDITGNLNLAGPGANQLTVSGNHAVTVFTVDSGANVAISGLTIANGHGQGGGIYDNGGSLTLSNSMVSNNFSDGNGGGIETEDGSMLTVAGSTFSGNSTSGNGGGIFNLAMVAIENSTFVNNSAGSGAGGGALTNYGGAMTVSDSTVTKNADSLGGGGIYNTSIYGTSVTNSIVAGNTTGDCYTCTQLGPNMIGGSPNLGALAYNGLNATLQTMIPLPGSPAIQAGSATLLPAGLTTDQRGFPRTTAGKLDLGAAQTNYTAIRFVQQPTDALINANIAPAVTVEVLETNTNLPGPSNTDAVNGIPITLTFSGTGTMGGTLTQTSAGGVASFGNLTVNNPGTGDTLATSLTVTPAGVTPAQTLTATSDPFDVTLQTSTVNFNPPLPASVTYGVSPLTLKANAYSSGTPTGQTLSFQVDSGPGVVSESVLTITGAGTIAVEVDAAANGSFGASDATASIMVNPTALTVTASNATRVYGAANPVFTGTIIGAVNGDSFIESFATTAIPTSNAGGYAIVPSAAGAHLADYTVTTANGTLTITAATSAITLTSSASSVITGASVTLTAAVASSSSTPSGMVTFTSGGATLGTANLNGGVATLTTAALPVGNDTITASYAGSPDFAASSGSATVTVALTIPPGYTLAATPNSLNITQGQTGSTTLALTPVGGFNGTVTLRCGNLPANVVCAFARNSVTLSGNNQPVNVGLTIQTSVQQARIEAIQKPTQSPLSPILPALAFWWPGGLAGLAALGRKRKLSKTQQRWLQFCLLLVTTGALAAGLAGCGGGGFGPYITPAESTMVTVTATATSGTTVTAQTANLTLNIAQ
jgi:hypothetical protein